MSQILGSCYYYFHPLKAGRRLYSFLLQTHTICISIPSRRVGDLIDLIWDYLRDDHFHPLKAGRRPVKIAQQTDADADFHPLKAGRRR